MKLFLMISISALFMFQFHVQKAESKALKKRAQCLPSFLMLDFCKSDEEKTCKINNDINGCFEACWCVDKPQLRYPEGYTEENTEIARNDLNKDSKIDPDEDYFYD
jgi:hypothetical protein